MKKAASIVWFKNDLRLHDNESICRAIANGQPILPVYIFDERNFRKLDLGFSKAEINRFQFLKQSLLNLEDNLKKIGGKLYVDIGIAEDIIPQLVKHYSITTIYAEEEYAYEELQIINNLKENLNGTCELVLSWGKTLYHIDDLPYTIEEIPATSKAYRINTANNASVRLPFLTPEKIVVLEDFPDSEFPIATDLGFKDKPEIKPYVNGGETNALKRLHHYSFETQQLTNYRWTRNRSLGMDYSSKLSPYLALGCISPRFIYQKVKQYEQFVKKNQSTWWIIFELVWRDFFTFKGIQIGNKMFLTEGFKNKKREWEYDRVKFNRWCNGKTGLPFVDAHMRQLNTTGFMSNRGRVNCASFLIHDYKIDWTWGAAYFESKLIDYDVSANWMNWHYQAFEIWYTNPINQSLKYKAKEFIQTYISELKDIDNNSIYVPWEYDIEGYPKPLEVFSKWQRSINKIKKTID